MGWDLYPHKFIFMQRISKVIQRTTRQMGAGKGKTSERFITRLSSRRVNPITVRTFATSSTSQGASHTVHQILQNPRFAVFSKTTAFSFGTLLCAGLWGYATNPKDTKDMKELKAKMEAIRKNYPNIRNFPVVYCY